MLNEERVRLMTRMAIFEKNEGVEMAAFANFDRKDYIGSRRLIAFVLGTIIYALVAGVVLILMLFNLMIDVNHGSIVTTLMVIGVTYVLFMTVYLSWVYLHSSKRYSQENRKIESYKRGLSLLEKLYEKEERETAPSKHSVAAATKTEDI